MALARPLRLFIFLRRLADLLEELPEESFARVGRSGVVRIEAVQRTDWKSRDETIVMIGRGAQPLVLGRMVAIRLRERLASP